MDLFSTAQGFVMLALGIAAVALELIAFVDCMRRPAQAFEVSGNQTKVTWLAITGVSLAVGFVVAGNVLNLFGMLAIVGAAVYMVRVRPQVASFGGGGRSGPTSGW